MLCLERLAAFFKGGVITSPIKGDVKRHFSPSPEAVRCSRVIQPFPTLVELFVLIRFWPASMRAADRCGSPYPCSFIAALWAAHPSSFRETDKRKWAAKVGNHGPIRDSRPIAFLDCPRGHRVTVETQRRSAHKSPNL